MVINPLYVSNHSSDILYRTELLGIMVFSGCQLLQFSETYLTKNTDRQFPDVDVIIFWDRVSEYDNINIIFILMLWRLIL